MVITVGQDADQQIEEEEEEEEEEEKKICILFIPMC